MDWRPIDDFPTYEISSDGLVRNAVSGCVLKPEAGHRGHLRVTLYNENGPQRHLVHRLVLLHFVGPAPSEEHECAHWDGEPANNSVANLRWATPKENTEDARRHGRLLVGEKAHFSKLTKAQATEIRQRVADGASTRALAEELRLNVSQVNRIARGEGWAHLGGPIRPAKPWREVDENTATQAVKAVEDGLPITEAAKKFGCSRQSINRRRYSPPEKLIHAAVVQHWAAFGLPGTLVATLANAYAHGQPGLTPGLFDLIVISPTLGDQIGFLELKADNGKLSAAQLEFKSLLIERGIRYAITYGRDQPIQVLEEWGATRRVRAAA